MCQLNSFNLQIPLANVFLFSIPQSVLFKRYLTSPSTLYISWAHTNSARLLLYFFIKLSRNVLCAPDLIDPQKVIALSKSVSVIRPFIPRKERERSKKKVCFLLLCEWFENHWCFLFLNPVEKFLSSRRKKVFAGKLWQRNSSPNNRKGCWRTRVTGEFSTLTLFFRYTAQENLVWCGWII